MFKESISKEELAELPLRQFSGEIKLIESARQVKDAVDYLRQFPVVGFDTETKPSFKKGQVHKVALLQLATDEMAFLFRVQQTGLPADLRRFFSDPAVLKPGVAIRDDLKALQELQYFRPGGFIELQDYARELGLQHFSLKKMSALVLGFRISKSQQLSNWEADQLTEAQMLYAATDAWVSLKIYENMFEMINNGTTVHKNNPEIG